MKKAKSVIAFLIFIVIVLLLGWYSYGIVRGTVDKDSDRGIHLGLDLAGGVSITYQVAGDETPSSEDMSDTVYQLQQRVSAYDRRLLYIRWVMTVSQSKFRAYLTPIRSCLNWVRRVPWSTRLWMAKYI